MAKDWRYSSYPFMRESSCLVDYEIRTDCLTSHIGHCISILRQETIFKEIIAILEHIQPLVYHANGSVRGRLAIEQADLDWLNQVYDDFVERAGEAIKQFVLPQGHLAATSLHLCRSEAKKSYRVLYKVSMEKEVPEILFMFLGLLANVLFVLCIETNKLTNTSEIPFISKSYGK